MLAGGAALDLVKVEVMATDAVRLVDALGYVPHLAALIIRLIRLQVSRFVGVSIPSIPRYLRGRAGASAARRLDGQGRDGREAQRQRYNQ